MLSWEVMASFVGEDGVRHTVCTRVTDDGTHLFREVCPCDVTYDATRPDRDLVFGCDMAELSPRWGLLLFVTLAFALFLVIGVCLAVCG